MQIAKHFYLYVQNVSKNKHALLSYQYKIFGTELHSSKHSQNDGHDMEEIGKDGSPLISQKVKHLPL